MDRDAVNSDDAVARWFYRHAPGAFAVIDGAGLVVDANPALARLAGPGPGDLVGAPLLDVLGQPPGSMVGHALERALAGGRASALLVLPALGDADTEAGATTERRWHLRLVHDPDLDAVLLIGVDRTEESKLAAQAKNRTVRDRLTGLINRDALTDELEHSLAAGQPTAVYLIDLDDFTLVNDTYGHRFGDMVLSLVSERLVRAGGLRCVVGRVGADQFALVARRLPDAAGVRTVGERLLEVVSNPLVVGSTPLHLTASVGAASVWGGAYDPLDLLREADMALNRATQLGGGQFVAFEERFHAEMAQRVRTEADLRTAIGSRQLSADLQAVYPITGDEPVAFEALARWRHPERGNVSPAEFIEVAERSDLLDGVLRAVMEASLEAAAPWLGADPDRYLSVNVAPSQLARDGIVDIITDSLELHRIDPGQLQLEITERDLVADARSVATVNRLADSGFSIAIDDFGAGASALGYLWQLPIRRLKLDRALVRPLTEDDTVVAVVRSLIRLARDIGVDVVAEGVETEDQLAVLRSLGCDHLQGYLWHRPEPAASLAHTLSSAEVHTLQR